MAWAGAGIAAAAAIASLAGCGGASPRSADLASDVRGYGNGLRWRDFAAAALRVAPARRADFIDEREQLDSDLRIVDWEMTRLAYDDDGNRGEVRLEYKWLLDSRGIVHTTVTEQSWSRHGDRWLIDREVRLRGDQMPGVDEPADRRRGQDAGNTVNRGLEVR